MSKLGSLSLAAAAVAALVAVVPAVTRGQGPTPNPIRPMPLPPSGDFPVDAATIDGWVAAGDEASMRGHAWALWGLLNTGSGQVYNGDELPIWETWADFQDLFTGGASTAFLSARLRGRSLNGFHVPLQFRRRGRHGLQFFDAHEDQRLRAINKFDPEFATFISARQPGPGGTTYFYGSSASLTRLNHAWAAGTPPQNRATNDFPVRAIETKPIFESVKATGLTVIPLWQGPQQSTTPALPTPRTWTTCVIVDPQGSGALRAATPGEVAAVRASAGACRNFMYGPLSLLYHFRLTPQDARNFVGAAAGDYAVLVAMHVNTREIANWTWQTFWWQPGADTPNSFPGSKAGQPSGLPGPSNNYAMCTAYSQTMRPGNATMRVCFNPYIEIDDGIPAGTSSNCMSCHGTARVGDDGAFPPDYRQPIALFTDPRYFNNGTTRTDFSWAVAFAP